MFCCENIYQAGTSCIFFATQNNVFELVVTAVTRFEFCYLYSGDLYTCDGVGRLINEKLLAPESQLNRSIHAILRKTLKQVPHIINTSSKNRSMITGYHVEYRSSQLHTAIFDS